MHVKALLISTSLAAATLAAWPAVAADIENCSGTQTCMWDDNNYQDKIASRTHGEAQIRNVSDAANDKMDSYANNSNTYQTCAWSNSNGTGDRQDWHENEHDDNVSPLNSDEVTSWRTKYGC